MNESILLAVIYLLGMVGRIVIPYIQARLWADGPLSFDWRMIVGQVIGAVIGMLGLFLTADFWVQVVGFAQEFSTVGPWAVYVAMLALGWFSTDIGRRGDKQLSS